MIKLVQNSDYWYKGINRNCIYFKGIMIFQNFAHVFLVKKLVLQFNNNRILSKLCTTIEVTLKRVDMFESIHTQAKKECEKLFVFERILLFIYLLANVAMNRNFLKSRRI